MKRILAMLATLAILACAFLVGRRPTTNAPGRSLADDSPTACIDRMFDAARRADVADYLECFAGDERARLDRDLRNRSPAEFAGVLLASLETMKGRAVSQDVIDLEQGRAQLTIERVYAERTDRQVYHLVRQRNTWRIDRIELADPIQPPKKYGTPVWEPE